MASLLPNRDLAWSSTFHFQQNWSVPAQPDRSSSFDSYQSEEPIPYASGNSRKLNHNASERHRRRKINSLYSSLRSLLPTAEQSTQKLSIPNTVARVVKYIPELQEEVERLVRKKEELSSRPRLAEDETRAAKRTCNRQIIKNLPAVSATRVGDDQIAAQICGQADRSILSHLVERMEDDGFLLLNLTSFHASPATVLYHLHFRHPVTGKGSGLVEPDEVCHKLLSLYEKGAKVCL